MAADHERQLLSLAIHEFYEIMFSSSSEESEDNDEEMFPNLFKQKEPIPRIPNYFEVIVPQYTAEQFKSHFSMLLASHFLPCMKAFRYQNAMNGKKSLPGNTWPKLTRKKPGCPTIPPDKQLLIAIWKMATPDSYRSICVKFNVGQATALKSVRRVTKALTDLSPVFITWPNEGRANEISNGFHATTGFPKVVGAIDGSHINIPAPRNDSES
ncbi:uncharacterized protein LOC124405875 [Diprion similis]|uniref:uncharacterized protein LOC124405875 n=1 Tax=Diprion similis TaxID=362088 RepID=UPI001EF80F8E|nr:uncharacterized protein LOC124405875 [Diprion similis]